MKTSESFNINFDIDDLETVGRKNGVLYLKKAFFRKRDLIIQLIETFERKTILITIGREKGKFENFKHFQIRAIIRVDPENIEYVEKESDHPDTFQCQSKNIPKAMEMAAELAQRGDVVLFSPYGTQEEIQSQYDLFDSKLESIGF